MRPYTIREDVVVVLARELGARVKQALVMSGPELPLRIRLSESEDDRRTHRICVEPHEGEDECVRVVLRGRDSDDVLRERTVRWEPGRKDELIAVIRELAGLGAV